MPRRGTGKTVWERRFSVYLTDVPEHRVALGFAGGRSRRRATSTRSRSERSSSRFSPDGKMLWERSMIDEYGAVTTHGGRTVSPVIDGDKVVINVLNAGVGRSARGGNRYFAFDKRTGARSGSARRRPGTGTPTTRRLSSPTSAASTC